MWAWALKWSIFILQKRIHFISSIRISVATAQCRGMKNKKDIYKNKDVISYSKNKIPVKSLSKTCQKMLKCLGGKKA